MSLRFLLQKSVPRQAPLLPPRDCIWSASNTKHHWLEPILEDAVRNTSRPPPPAEWLDSPAAWLFLGVHPYSVWPSPVRLWPDEDVQEPRSYGAHDAPSRRFGREPLSTS